MKPNLYPMDDLHQLKIKELLQQLTEIKEILKDFQVFSGAERLFEEAELLLADEENTQAEKIITCINEINKFNALNEPVQHKFKQLDLLKSLIKKYCDPNEVQGLNAAIAILENGLKTEISEDSRDSNKIEAYISKIDLSSYKNLKKILGKIKQILSEKAWDARYKDYLTSQLELINSTEKKINEKSTEISECFDIVKFVIESTNELETNHEYFINLTINFNLTEKYFHKLIPNLVNIENVNSYKDEIDNQIKILSEKFIKFDPRSESSDTLTLGMGEFGQKLNELHQLNQNELQNQQDTFIRLIEDSKQDLTDYAKKLSLLKSKCANNKAEQLQSIIQKIDLLLNPEINREENASNREITPDKILDLKETVKNANSILSEYRGISLLRCFATLWGGGKVTSQLLVNTLDKQLTDLQSNITMISPNL